MSESLTLVEASKFCFETTHLRCRLLSEDDEALYRGLYSSDSIMRYIMKPLTKTSANKSFRSAMRCFEQFPLQRLFFVVEHKADEVALGILGISSLDWQQYSCEYGLMLTRSGQGKNYAFEITQACLYHLTAVLGMKRIWVDISEQNSAALKVAHRVGFKPCRTNLRLHEYLSG
ncbi:GNAT family N-acetyltransferase [Alkalimonas sp. NCh-2]|uniref:GNAT family N-acetyltransferase n=1 Tax=Alkalimonas sp. NCh-2 TaxID=3144846 RepID=UPI0031F6ECA2